MKWRISIAPGALYVLQKVMFLLSFLQSIFKTAADYLQIYLYISP